MDTVLSDVRYAARTLLRTPGFTLVALLTIALGVGANSAVFSVVNSIVVKPLPFREPDRLVKVTGEVGTVNAQDVGLSIPELDDLRASGAFTQAAGVYPISANLTGTDEPARVDTLLVSANYFELLGVSAAHGRVFGSQDEVPGIAEVAVISDGFWRRSFGSDPAVVGSRIRIDADLYTVIGVLPAEFRHPGRSITSDVDVWAPSGYRASPFGPPRRGANFLSGVLARLAPGVSLADAQHRLDRMADRLRVEAPNDYPAEAHWRPHAEGLKSDLVGSVRQSLLTLLAAVGFVLLIACVNIANLLLTRTAARRHETAIRRALGASRARLVRQLLIESLLLALIGGGLGLLTALWATDFLISLSPASIPRLDEVSVDLRVVMFALGVSIVTGLVFGLVPALQPSAAGIHQHLKDGVRSAPPSQNTTRRSLVVAEMSLAFVLLVGAGLLVRSFWQLQRVDPGFDSGNLLVARMWLPQPNQPETGPYFQHERRLHFIRELIRRASLLPGATSVAMATTVPFSGPFVAGPSNGSFTIEGRGAEMEGLARAQAVAVTPSYFHTMGIELVRGRDFEDRDAAIATRFVVVSQSMVDRYWPGQDPIGKRIRPGGRTSTAPWLEIIGVVRDVKSDTLEQAWQPHIYASLLQSSSLQLVLAVRGTRDLSSLALLVRREVKSIDAEIPVFGVRTMSDLMSASMAERRFSMQLMGLFAVAALMLATIGVYGVIAYGVNQQRKEFGIRMALGATRRGIMGRVLSQGLRPAVAGMAVGLFASFALVKVMAGMLFKIPPGDPATFASMVGILSVAALVASLVPAWSATRFDPMRVLRDE